MLAVPTPARLAQRAEFYHQLSQLTDAGLTLHSALESQERHPPASWLREPATRLLAYLKKGGTFGEAVTAGRDWIPQFDAALLEAGEQSGRLPASFKLLAEHYQERSRLAREVLANLAYPAFLLHFFILLWPVQQLVVKGDVFGYLRNIGAVLLPLYAIIVFLLFAANGQRGELWRGFLEKITSPIPVLGQARRNLAVARLASALHALINAGVPIVRAWESAANASGSVGLKREIGSWRPELEAGRTPAELVSETRLFPELFANTYNAGEISGTLDDSLVRMQRLYHERGVAQFRAIAQWTPKLIYTVIALVIAWWVISFWTNYFGQIGDILK
jgi:type II secretory pathway component PulF